jgi:hypothetical protein
MWKLLIRRTSRQQADSSIRNCFSNSGVVHRHYSGGAGRPRWMNNVPNSNNNNNNNSNSFNVPVAVLQQQPNKDGFRFSLSSSPIRRGVRTDSKRRVFEYDADDNFFDEEEQYLRWKVQDDWSDDDQPEREDRKQSTESGSLEGIKTGRGFSDPWDLEDILTSTITYEDLPDFSPSYVSRVSQERVQIYKEKIPTLQALASPSEVPLPKKGPPPHPGLGQAKSYALYRKRSQYQYISEQVKALAEPKVAAIESTFKNMNDDVDSKQDAIDELYEDIDNELRDREPIMGKHPMFSKWVQKALEEYLTNKQYQFGRIPY